MTEETLLRAILSMIARTAIPEDRLIQIVAPKAGAGAQIAAYNMCDGTMLQAEIAKALKIDTGNFSRTVARWIEAGVVIKLGEKNDAKLLHIYPLPKEGSK